jgi:Ribbon-helix-helix protein, copG family
VPSPSAAKFGRLVVLVIFPVSRFAALVYYLNMPKSIKVVPKKRGRPATGRDPVTAIRLSPELRAAIDAWAARQDDKPPRSEAIRRMIEQALAAAPMPKLKARPSRK